MKKTLALILAAFMLFSMALAEKPIVDTVLDEHDVDVEAGTVSPIFTITPNGEDFTWSILRFEDGVWAPATESNSSSSAPLTGSGSADGNGVVINWDYWFNGDYTGYDGGVEHKLEVSVNETVVTAVTFYVNYFMNHAFDRVSLLSWFEDEDGSLSTTRACWYPNNTANSFGPKVDGTWQTYSAIDLSVEGEQIFDLVAAGAWKIGIVKVNVSGDEVIVTYEMIEDWCTTDTWDDITVDSEYLNLFGDAASIDLTAESTYAFGQPISIANDLGGDTTVALVISNQVDYPSHSPFVTRFWSNHPANKAIVDAMIALLAE